MKKSMLKISSYILFALLAITSGLYLNIIRLPITTSVHVSYAADFSDDRILVGASHNVFVAQIIKKTSNEITDVGPVTHFNARIIHCIKGELKGSVKVEQQGGYENGILHLVDFDPLLEEGAVYILATRFHEENDSHIVNCHRNGKYRLSGDFSDGRTGFSDGRTGFSDSDLKRISELESAYKEEILLEADIQRLKTENSYKYLLQNS